MIVKPVVTSVCPSSAMRETLRKLNVEPVESGGEASPKLLALSVPS
jgi:hypothetical protein